MHQACIALLIPYHGIGSITMHGIAIAPGCGGDQTHPGLYPRFSRDVLRVLID